MNVDRSYEDVDITTIKCLTILLTFIVFIDGDSEESP